MPDRLRPWPRQLFVAVAVAGAMGCLGTPAAVHAVDSTKLPAVSDVEAEVQRLQLQIDARRMALDSLLSLRAAVPESLTDFVQEEIEVLQDRLEVEFERLQQIHATTRDGADASEPQAPRPPSRRKKIAENMIRFGEDVEVRRDESVNGDAILVRGNLFVQGEVEGDAIVIAGNLNLGRTAVIRGQAIAVGGRVETNRGAEVEGQTVSLTLFPRSFPWFPGGWPGWVGLLLDVLNLGFLILVSGLLLLVVPDRLLRARAVLGESFLRCFGVGLLVLMGGSCAATVAMILLSVTLVGIPAALVLAFAVSLLLVASLVVGVLLIGDRLQDMMHRGTRPPLYSVLLGLVLVLLPKIVSDLLHLASPVPFGPLGLGLLSFVLVGSTLSAGLGAIVLTRFGGGWSRQRSQPAV